jgi:hypothetical protein
VFGWADLKRPRSTLALRHRHEQHPGVDAEELISRGEVTAMLFTFADINANVERIVQLLEDEEDREQEAPQEDS